MSTRCVQKLASYTQQLCKTCESPRRAFIEEKLKSSMSLRELTQTLRQLGESISREALAQHKKNHMAPPHAEELEALKQQLVQEAAGAPPTVAVLYHMLIKSLESLNEMKPNADTVVRISKAISEITGMKTQQRLLLAFMEHKFPEPLPATTTVTRLGLPESSTPDE